MRKLALVFLGSFLLAAAFWGLRKPAALPEGQPIDKLVVLKSKRQLLAYSDGKLLKTYRVALGQNPVGAKQVEGDRKTPEGQYTINDKNLHSAYHKNLGISYPNAQDKAEARLLGKPAGGLIKIHGMRNGHGYLGLFHTFTDWTLGCIAVTNAEVDELYAHTPIGTPIEIKP